MFVSDSRLRNSFTNDAADDAALAEDVARIPCEIEVAFRQASRADDGPRSCIHIVARWETRCFELVCWLLGGEEVDDKKFVGDEVAQGQRRWCQRPKAEVGKHERLETVCDYSL